MAAKAERSKDAREEIMQRLAEIKKALLDATETIEELETRVWLELEDGTEAPK